MLQWCSSVWSRVARTCHTVEAGCDSWLWVQIGKVFGDSAQLGPGDGQSSSDGYGDAEEQMRRQSGIEIDLRSGAIKARSAVTTD